MDTLALAAESDLAVRAEREALQGCWSYISGIREAQLLIVGDHFALKFDNGENYIGRFQLDPTHKPKAMDMVVLEGPERHKGKTASCIYELDGLHLTWCPGAPGKGERPLGFPPADDAEHLCVVFRREKPPNYCDFIDD